MQDVIEITQKYLDGAYAAIDERIKALGQFRNKFLFPLINEKYKINQLQKNCSVLHFVKQSRLNEYEFFIQSLFFDIPNGSIGLNLYKDRISEDIFNLYGIEYISYQGDSVEVGRDRDTMVIKRKTKKELDSIIENPTKDISHPTDWLNMISEQIEIVREDCKVAKYIDWEFEPNITWNDLPVIVRHHWSHWSG